MVSANLPPFPKDCPTHPLLVIDYHLVKAGDEGEINRLWQAATELGFWYLKNHGLEDKADELFALGAKTLSLPLEEKMKFEQGDSGMSHGYKAFGSDVINEDGDRDRIEFINVAKDDIAAFPNVVYRAYPSPVNVGMEVTIKPFIRGAEDINETFLEVFNDKLGLPKGVLLEKHKRSAQSGSQARVTRSPSHSSTAAHSDRAALVAHTDFGSLSLLFNRLGGLQVLVPGTQDWQYILPIPGHAICNVGDALYLFSGGILRSNMHRVVAPPGAQGDHERYSAVFFLRPSNDVFLQPLKDNSTVIAEAIEQLPDSVREKLDATPETAKEWFARRVRYGRFNNFKGPETWRAARGTEHRM